MSGILFSHGVRFRFNFLAGHSYEDPDGNVWVYGSEPWWDEADLTDAQRAEVDEWVAEHRAARPQDSEMFARWGTLEHNGVRHTHRRGRPVFEHRPAYGYYCAMCDAAIVNENPGDFRFVGGPADGRWFVTDGGPVWRVPVPQPVSAAIATATLRDVGMDVATYYRRGNRYVFSPR